MKTQPSVKDLLKKHALMLTDQSMEGRLSGTQGAKVAATYLSSSLQEMGYLPHPENSHFQVPIQVFASRLVGQPQLKVGNKRYQHRTEFAENNRVSSGGKAEGRLLVVIDGVPFDEECLKDSIVLIPEVPAGFDLSATVGTAVEHGVKALLVESGEPKWFHKTVFGLRQPDIPVLRIKKSIAEEIAAMDGQDVSIVLPLENQTLPCQNVIGFLPGTGTSHTVVLSAHYDHLGDDPGGFRFPGAIDNVSGVITVLEAARQLVAKGLLPFNLVIAFFSGEESGLDGAYQFIETYPDTITAAINIDCVGQEFPVSLARIGYEAPDHWLPIAAQHVLASFKTNIKWGESGREDSVAFRKNKIPALALSQKSLKQNVSIHTPADNVTALHFEALEDWVKLTVNLVNELALNEPYLKGGEEQ